LINHPIGATRPAFFLKAASIAFILDGHGKKKKPMNGLLNGLVFYAKTLDEVAVLGPTPFTNTNNVTFGTGPVSGEGNAIFAGSDGLTSPAGAAISDFGTQDFAFSVWIFLASDPTGQNIISVIGNSDVNGFFVQAFGAGASDPNLRDKYTFYIPGNDESYADDCLMGNIITGAWVHLFGWWTAIDSTLHGRVNNGTVNTFSFIPSGPADVTNQLFVGGINSDAQKVASIGLWVGTIPDNTQQGQLYNSGAGLPFSAFDSGGLGGGVVKSPWPDEASGFLSAVRDKWNGPARSLG